MTGRRALPNVAPKVAPKAAVDRCARVAVAVWLWVVPPAALTACSGGGGGGSADGTSRGGSSGPTVDASAGAGARAGHGGSGAGGTDGGGASAGISDGGGADGGYANVGVCGRRGQATADATSFSGYEERYLIGEQGFGTDICVVRFDLARVGDAPGGCSDCVWTHLLQYSNPMVATNTGGVCANSDLALDANGLAKLAGSRIAIGFAKQLGGAHGSARMTYNDATATWEVTGNATWNETSTAFKFDYREGICNYGS